MSSQGVRVSCADRCTRTIEVEPGESRRITARPGPGRKLSWGGACRQGGPVCVLEPARRTVVQVTFLRRGARSNPVPVGEAEDVPGGWRLRVRRVNPDGTASVLGANPGLSAPARGGQYFVAWVEATYLGGGKSRFGGRRLASLTGQMTAVGRKGVYPLKVARNACGPFRVALPAPDAQRMRDDVFSGTTVSGRVCFEIASNDEPSLKLRISPRAGEGGQDAWFALSTAA